jgi:hypothetical protein
MWEKAKEKERERVTEQRREKRFKNYAKKFMRNSPNIFS